jgi:hypothetical protein
VCVDFGNRSLCANRIALHVPTTMLDCADWNLLEFRQNWNLTGWQNDSGLHILRDAANDLQRDHREKLARRPPSAG